MNEKPRIRNAQEAACPAGFENENNTPDMRERALALAASGFLVFPVTANAKRPPVHTGWQERATADLEKVRRMWTSATGEAEAFNIGIATGRPLPNGDTLFVVDLDTDAEHTVKDRTKALGTAVPDLPLSVSAWTPGKGGNRGGHVYLACPAGEEVRNSVKKIDRLLRNANPKDKAYELADDGIDVRGLGGYVVGPGSIVDGREYEWARGASPSARAIAAAPRALLDLCNARPATERGDGTRKSPPPRCELDTPRAIEHARQWLRDAAPEAKQGEGGRGATKQVIQRLGDLGLSSAGIFDLLSEAGGWNETKADPPWAIDSDDSDGFRRQIDDLWSFHREKPAGCDFPYAAAEVFQAVEIEERAPGDGSSADMLAPKHLKALEEDIPARQWIVEGIAARGFVTALVADPGVGKTQWFASLAVAVATGRGEIAGVTVRERTRVWSWNQEDGQDEMERRFRSVRIAHGVEDLEFEDTLRVNSGVRTRFKLAVRGAGGAPREGPDLPKFIDHVREQKIGLLQLDPLSELHGLGENANEEIRFVWETARKIAQEGNCAVIIAAHTRKPDQAAQSDANAGDMYSLRGGGAQVGVARLVLTLTTMGDKTAKTAGIPGKDRLSWIRLDGAKANIGKRGGATRWFYHEPINIRPRDAEAPEEVSCLMPRNPGAVEVEEADAIDVLADALFAAGSTGAAQATDVIRTAPAGVCEGLLGGSDHLSRSITAALKARGLTLGDGGLTIPAGDGVIRLTHRGRGARGGYWVEIQAAENGH